MLGWIAWSLLLIITIRYSVSLYRAINRHGLHVYYRLVSQVPAKFITLSWILIIWTLFLPLPKWNIIWITILYWFFLFVVTTQFRIFHSPGIPPWAILFTLFLSLITYRTSLSPYNLLMPWVTGFAFAAVMIVARLLTNWQLRIKGFYSAWTSSLYLLGQIGLIASAAYFIISVGWSAAIPPVFCHLLTELIASDVTRDKS
jgi:hypothetical protein